MAENEIERDEEAELRAAIEAVLSSPSDKKLVIAGPGTGKTTLFKHAARTCAWRASTSGLSSHSSTTSGRIWRTIWADWLRYSHFTRTVWVYFTATQHSEARFRRTFAAAPGLQASSQRTGSSSRKATPLGLLVKCARSQMRTIFHST